MTTTSSAKDAFTDRVDSAFAVNRSWLIVGLDPVLDRLPAPVPRTPQGVQTFNLKLIEATADLVAGFKLNFAYYEALGREGWHVLDSTRRAIPADLLAIADAKRGDIGPTAEAYAEAIFDGLRFDAATVMPYSGTEGVRPFLRDPARGAFVVCRTSNRDDSIQIVPVNGRPLYEYVARQAVTWGPNVGLVVGATDIQALKTVRAIAPETLLLMPGVGAQGGNLAEAVAAGRDSHGGGTLVPVSRAVAEASSGPDYAEAARSAALAFRDEITRALGVHSSGQNT